MQHTNTTNELDVTTVSQKIKGKVLKKILKTEYGFYVINNINNDAKKL